MKYSILILAWLTPLIPVLSGTAGANRGSAQEPEREPPDTPKVERLAAWPECSDKARVRKDVQRLRKARTPEMGEQAGDALIAEGAAVVPFLLPALSKEKNKEALARIYAVLNSVTDARHTRLLAEEFEHASASVRAWTLERVAAFPDPGLAGLASARLKHLRANPKKFDVKEIYVAALCATSTGSLDGLDVLVENAHEKWAKGVMEMRAILAPVRGKPATERVAKGLEGDRKSQINALRLLGGCGDAGSVTLVRPFLDSTDRGVQLAAINALRGIVDGDPPLEKLPVFEMIERANQWKQRT